LKKGWRRQLSSDLKYCPQICLAEIMNTTKIGSQDELSALGIETASLGIWSPTVRDTVMVSYSTFKTTLVSPEHMTTTVSQNIENQIGSIAASVV
jgi:hypothetical protein